MTTVLELEMGTRKERPPGTYTAEHMMRVSRGLAILASYEGVEMYPARDRDLVVLVELLYVELDEMDQQDLAALRALGWQVSPGSWFAC